MSRLRQIEEPLSITKVCYAAPYYTVDTEYIVCTGVKKEDCLWLQGIIKEALVYLA